MHMLPCRGESHSHSRLENFAHGRWQDANAIPLYAFLAGTSLADQWVIREEVRARFPGKPWIDVFSKEDMLHTVLKTPSEPDVSISAAQAEENNGKRDYGVQEASQPEDTGVRTAPEMVARLPGALRVSSLTHNGLSQLQQSIVDMLLAEERRKAQVAADAKAKATAAAILGLGLQGLTAPGTFAPLPLSGMNAIPQFRPAAFYGGAGEDTGL